MRGEGGGGKSFHRDRKNIFLLMGNMCARQNEGRRDRTKSKGEAERESTDTKDEKATRNSVIVDLLTKSLCAAGAYMCA